MVRKVLQPFYTGYVVCLFAASILLIFPFFAILSLGRNVSSRRAIFTIVRYWARWWLWMIGMPVKCYGAVPPTGRYVIIANHISYLDTLVIFPSIPGYFRILGKKEIAKIPLIGLVYKQLVILVDRSSANSRAKSMRLLWRVVRNDGSILIFPEGTFNETGDPLKSFYDGAFRLAINTQTPIFPVIFPDTVDRWHYSAWWKMWPGTNRVVFLPPVPVAGIGLDGLEDLKQGIYEIMEREIVKSKK